MIPSVEFRRQLDSPTTIHTGDGVQLEGEFINRDNFQLSSLSAR